MLRALFLPVSTLLIISAAVLVPLPVYLERPGEPLSLEALVAVEYQPATALDGDFLLTVVTLSPGTAAGLLQGWAADDTNLLWEWQVVPPGLPEGEFFRRQRQLFDVTGSVAAAVGLASAGFDVDPESLTGDGVLVVRVLPDTPADSVLRPGDVIVAVDGVQVSTAEDLREAIAAAPEGALTFRVRRDDETLTVELDPERVPASPVPIIGIEPETLHARIDLPIEVQIDARRIGGPSAGLMIALTVYDKVQPDVDLAGGRVVAGTGTIAPGGRVGEIGGIALKARAAVRDGADVFLAPASQVEDAREAVPEGAEMRVIGVTTFADAVAALQPGG